MKRNLTSPSMIVASVALVIALGGTSYAALALPRNSVGSSQIRANAVTGPKVKSRSLAASDFRRGALPRGKTGASGAPGPRGPSGIAGIVQVDGAERSYAPGTYGASPNAVCPAGTVVVGTGFFGPFNVVGGFVLAFGTFVGGYFENDSSITLTASVQAICARTSSAVAAHTAARRRDQMSAYRRKVAAFDAKHEARLAR